MTVKLDPLCRLASAEAANSPEIWTATAAQAPESGRLLMMPRNRAATSLQGQRTEPIAPSARPQTSDHAVAQLLRVVSQPSRDAAQLSRDVA